MHLLHRVQIRSFPKTTRLLLWTVVAAIGGISCQIPSSPSDSLVCTAHIQPGIVVEIRAKADNEPLAYSAQGRVSSGSYTDSLKPGETLTSDPRTMVSRQAAHERPGTYSVEVAVAGFQPVEFQNVTVLPGQCHVQTAYLQALLEPVQ
jgi:hypothetical protein